jgi:hypothetical protein
VQLVGEILIRLLLVDEPTELESMAATSASLSEFSGNPESMTPSFFID